MNLNRRMFGLLAGAGLASTRCGMASAQTANASLLDSTLTPFGAEQAGNADGSIPAWTGGFTTMPAGLQPNDYIPELFPNETPVVEIDSSNMSQHADRLSEGVMAMMTKYGFKIKVFPTHRTAAASQYIYDNIKKNLSTAQLGGAGGRFGFSGAYGGMPFPIPDASDPALAGTQIMWNQNCNYRGHAWQVIFEAWANSSGQMIQTYASFNKFECPYYDPSGSLTNFDGRYFLAYNAFQQPANLLGQVNIAWQYTEPYQHPQQVWQLENGQGRVRRAPELSFDTPASFLDGIANFDEFFGFNGSLERYDWKCLGKKEMYVPYNNNAIYGRDAEATHLTHFFDPNVVRWELHRVWVVEAVLHPGERNVLARRLIYIDEDTWLNSMIDAWDANGNLYKVNLVYNYCRPDLPATIYGNNTVHNLQTDNYCSVAGAWRQAQHASFSFEPGFRSSTFDPANMAASAQY